MNSKKLLLLIGVVAVIALGVAVAMKRPHDVAPAPVAQTTAPAAAPAEAAPEPGPAASDAPACTQYNWDGTAWVCTAPAAAGSN